MMRTVLFQSPAAIARLTACAVIRMIKAYLLFICFMLFAGPKAIAQSAGDYRSKQTGNWNVATNWERYDGANWVDAPAAPSSADGVITIRNGHTVNMNQQNATIDQSVVESGATLHVETTFIIADGPGDDLTVNGTLALSAGDFRGSGTIAISGPTAAFNWMSGWVRDVTININTDAGMNLDGNNNRALEGDAVINNYGTFNWSEGNINNGIWNNNSSRHINNYGTLNTTGNVNFNYSNGNNGLFINQPGGVINIVSGTFNFNPGNWFTNEGTITGNGTLLLNSGFGNIGTIAPGASPGILTINGVAQPLAEYDPTQYSTLEIEMHDGSGPGTGHDQLQRDGNLTLAGTLNVTETGCLPSGSYVIIQLTSGVISGNFSTVNLPLGYSITVNSSNVVLDYDDDVDGDGAVNCGDCAPTDPAKWRSATLYIDNDGDGYDNGTEQVCYGADVPEGYSETTLGADCNDNNAAINSATVWYKDTDNDGYSDGTTLTQCEQPAGYKLASELTATSGDCDDDNAAINPETVWYKDTDNDGYSDGATVTQCEQPEGYKLADDLIATSGDCNDDNADIHPGTTEICGNGIDEDCDGKYDDCEAVDSDGDGVPDDEDCDPFDPGAWRSVTLYIDNDGDGYDDGSVSMCIGSDIPFGYSESTNGPDCNDNNPDIHPGAIEECDGIDNNCNGEVDEGVLFWIYPDNDGDGYGTEEGKIYACSVPAGYSDIAGDCDDGRADIHPGATEICGNGIDEDCDDSDGECTEVDSDGDGVPDEEDCAPNDAARWHAAELYIDNDGDGYDSGKETVCYGDDIPAGYSETTKGTDCDDNDAAVNPETVWYKDADDDGYSDGTTTIQCTRPDGYKAASELISTNSDCDDDNASVNPGAAEECDGIDNDCSGEADEGCSEPEPTAFYSKPAGDLHNTSTWGTNPDGSGDNPTDFGSGKTFTLANRAGTYSIISNWAIEGILHNPAGSSLQINGHTLSLAGLSGEGTLSGSGTSALVITGPEGDFGTIRFSAGGGSLQSLTLNRNGTATIGTPLSIYDELTVTSGTLYTGDQLTLKSTVDNTARVTSASGSVSGNVTVERYIPARRAWRLINAPVGGNQSINDAWQEGATLSSSNPNPYPGYGTIITKGSAANGFDQDLPNQQYSILSYDNPTDTWNGITNTRTTAVNKNPYFLFVRGDRTTTITGAGATTLRATGPLQAGDQIIPVNATGFTAVANPFVSPIDFAAITRKNVDNSFYVWDPKMGGVNGVGAYVNISFNGTGYDITPASVSPESQYIQSGQSFMVHASGGPAGLVIKESDRSATPAQNVFKVMEGKNEGLVIAPARNAYGVRLSLQSAEPGGGRAVLDEVFTSYGDRFSDDIDGMDVKKIYNFRENISLARKGYDLMVERRSPIENADTLYLQLGNLAEQAYFFEIKPLALGNLVSVALEDSYAKTTTPVSSTENTPIQFYITGDEASRGVGRFRLLLQRKGAEPLITEPSIKAYPNPLIGGELNLSFTNVERGTYHIDMVSAGGHVVSRQFIHHAGGNAVHHLRMGMVTSGVYHIKIVGPGLKTNIKLLKQ